MTSPPSLSLRPYTFPLPNTSFQGFGASLSWWTNLPTLVPLHSQLLPCLFSPTGLNLTWARFDLGGTEDPTRNIGFRAGGNVPVEFQGTSQFAALQSVVHLRAGLPLHVELFSNSPPQHLTKSGTTAGAWNRYEDNLPADNIPLFASHLVDRAQTILALGVPVDSISPINEPSESFWVAGNNQEGCYWSQQSRSWLAGNLSQLMRDSGLTQRGVQLALAEEHTIAAQVASLSFMTSGDVLNVHTYRADIFSSSVTASLTSKLQDTDQTRALVFLRALTLSLPVRMSEFTWGGPKDTDRPPSVHDVTAYAVPLIRQVVRDVTSLGAVRWAYWQPVEDVGSTFGLMQVDFTGGNSTIIAGAQYHAMYLLARTVQAGTATFDYYYDEVRVAVSNPRVGAALFAAGGSSQATFAFPQRSGTFTVTRLREISGISRLEELGTRTVEEGQDVVVAQGTVEMWSGVPYVPPPVNGSTAGRARSLFGVRSSGGSKRRWAVAVATTLMAAAVACVSLSSIGAA